MSFSRRGGSCHLPDTRETPISARTLSITAATPGASSLSALRDAASAVLTPRRSRSAPSPRPPSASQSGSSPSSSSSQASAATCTHGTVSELSRRYPPARNCRSRCCVQLYSGPRPPCPRGGHRPKICFGTACPMSRTMIPTMTQSVLRTLLPSNSHSMAPSPGMFGSKDTSGLQCRSNSVARCVLYDPGRARSFSTTCAHSSSRTALTTLYTGWLEYHKLGLR
mmetsp:Transcript_41683/g.124513  ORF Transcript_41683/g.124513 Transcript_41683/m.124513 type:complete len:224 (-) Transcript_41683:21-692(-)